MFVSHTVSEIFSIKWRDLEIEVRIVQGRWKWRLSIDSLRLRLLLVCHSEYSSVLYHFRVLWRWIISWCMAYLAELMVSSSAENCRRPPWSIRPISSSGYSKPRLRIKFAEYAFCFSGPAEQNCTKPHSWLSLYVVDRWFVDGGGMKHTK